MRKRKPGLCYNLFTMKKKTILLILMLLLFFIPFSMILFLYLIRKRPAGTNVKSQVYHTNQVDFLYDQTYLDEEGQLGQEQEIFSEVYQLIEEAEEFILLDFFLFHDAYDPRLDFPALSRDLTQVLVAKKEAYPELPVIFISDPVNGFYGAYESNLQKELKKAGIIYVETDLKALAPSNPFWSAYYYAYLYRLPESGRYYLPNVMDLAGQKVGLRHYFRLFNFTANHRKVAVSEKAGIVTSANPHDASAHNSNIAFQVAGPVLSDLLESELAVLRFSADSETAGLLEDWVEKLARQEDDGLYEVQLLTEQRVKEAVLDLIEKAEEGDRLSLAMFYLGDRSVIEGLKDAARRGVRVRLILDINQEAFGRQKIGIPNRMVAHEMIRSDAPVEIRWAESHGEQFHTKMLICQSDTRQCVIGGSSNFTKKNLDNYNLETDLGVSGPRESGLMQEIDDYFERLWHNKDGTFTADYEEYAEESLWKDVLYRIQDSSGMSTF